MRATTYVYPSLSAISGPPRQTQCTKEWRTQKPPIKKSLTFVQILPSRLTLSIVYAPHH
jgi:hypothetical protein